jgi:hypothetical protein
VIDTLQRGLRWLYNTPQPDGAVLSHHGVILRTPVENRNIRLIPLPDGSGPIVVLEVARVRYDPEDGTPTNPLAPGELEAFAGALTDLGHEVIATWNGHPGASGSARLARPAHPTLTAAVGHYLAGCPEHPEKSVFCCCGWLRSDLVRRPDSAPDGSTT